MQVGADDVIDLPANDTRKVEEGTLPPPTRVGGPGQIPAGVPGSGALGLPRAGPGAPTHTAVWRRSEKTRSVKSASSPARAALGTTR